MEDNTFAFMEDASVDCLVCHDRTGTYMDAKGECGYVDKKKTADLEKIAQSVGKPGRENCGSCHWYGGGGDNVKHGDMDSALADPSREHDVHMGGLGFRCQDCHTTTNHKIAGRSTTSSASEGKVACTDCHDQKPHDSSSALLEELNDHCDTVSCEACHIPKYAKQAHTTTLWDWSQSGREDKVLEKDENKEKILSKKKGLLVRQGNLTPDYEWYNGKHRRYLKGDPASSDDVTYLNHPQGDISDPDARITPYKIMRGVEPADPENGHSLITPKLFGKGGYFETFDWVDAARKGMEASGLSFSGKVAFVETIMHWRLNHQVAPKEQSLSCLDCHGCQGVMDFKALGYKGDPATIGGRDLKGRN